MQAPEKVKGRGPCPSTPGTPPAVQFRPDRFRDLSPDGRRLITGWLSRADAALAAAGRVGPGRQALVSRSPHMFEAFIYAWISFNGWASCCCDHDADGVLIKVLRADKRVIAQFDALVDADSTVASALDQFRALWPIFRAADLRSGRDTAERTYRESGRAALVAYYSHRFPEAVRSPDCHLSHDPEADWAHTLEALYRVRCNLFHGAKSAYGAVDREIVEAASAVLVPVVKHMVEHRFT